MTGGAHGVRVDDGADPDDPGADQALHAAADGALEDMADAPRDLH
jgi:hypothetical protein